MLTRTIAEIQEVLPKLISNLNSTSNLPNFDAVEQKYLTPLIGDALYDDLTTKYLASTLTDDEKILVKHMRLVTASYGLLDDLASTHVFLTDQGVRVNESSNMQKAVGWEYKELKKFLGDKALDGVEVLLGYMWKKKADLGLWTASDAYKQFNGLLIRNATDFNDQYRLYQPQRTFYAMKNILRDAQSFYIVSGFGEDLLTYFLGIAAPADDEKAILAQLKKGLAFMTVKHACEHLPVQFGETGFSTISALTGGDRETDDSGRGPATVATIKMKMEVCDREGKNFLLKAKRLAVAFYKDDASDEFKTALDAGPLKGYLDPSEKTSGNERRRIFRF
jgi:hypothetical protein